MPWALTIQRGAVDAPSTVHCACDRRISWAPRARPRGATARGRVSGSLPSRSARAHEDGHAPRAWVLDRDRKVGGNAAWRQTPDGRAFAAAVDADRPTIDPLVPVVDSAASTNAARICTFGDAEDAYTGFGWAYVRAHLRQRVAWTTMWLRRR